jgi:hypothetical protein
MNRRTSTARGLSVSLETSFDGKVRSLPHKTQACHKLQIIQLMDTLLSPRGGFLAPYPNFEDQGPVADEAPYRFPLCLQRIGEES